MMEYKGGWWVGTTKDGVRVSVTHPFFDHIATRQLNTLANNPWHRSRNQENYGVAMVCQAPQWWIDAFQEIQDGVGPTPHVWTRRKGYAKVVLEADPDKYAAVPIPKPAGTIIFRQT